MVAQKKGTRLQRIEPENSTMYWDFAGTTYLKFRSLNENTDGGLLNKLIAIDCEDTAWQKVNPSLCTLKQIVTIWKDKKAEFDQQAEEDDDLPERAVMPDSISRQRSRLASKNKSRVASSVSSSQSQSSDNFIDEEDDDSLDELEELIDELED